MPYGGRNYFADAGRLELDPDFLPDADPAFYRGHSGKKVKKTREVEQPKMDKDGKPAKDDKGKPVLEKKQEEYEDFDWTRQIPKAALDAFDGKWDRLIARGKERYAINCSMCHGLTGGGGSGDTAHGILGRKGMAGIANYHDDRLRVMDDGEIFNTITMGKGQMSAYGHQVRPLDRWAIVSYVRVLQFANAPYALEGGK